ncbi:endonuclease/exonuclease/phosphatase family protein [Brachybacterium sp.]|uniref:endonuclease/exonuclease/phosphatase family protein n=1 Tax=Brachybacterium sp. TaxID=1891286 RepID=UPI002ED02E73
MASANIRHGLGPDGRVDLGRSAAELRALGADVIGVQEIDAAYGPRSGRAEQPTLLAELLGMQLAFGAALDLPPARAGEPRRRYGVALLTRHEILSHHMHPLPDHPAAAAPGEPRGVLRARLRRADGEELDVLVTHLEAGDGAHRVSQVQGIVRLTDALAGPVVMMGDMNADPASPELAALPATGWQDAAQLVESATATIRASSRRALPPPLHRRLMLLRDLMGRRPVRPMAATHPAGFPVRRIDALWVRGGIAVSAFAVGPRGSSDHRAVTATLHLPR